METRVCVKVVTKADGTPDEKAAMTKTRTAWKKMDSAEAIQLAEELAAVLKKHSLPIE